MTDNRLIEILNNSFSEQYEKSGLITAYHTANDLLANGVIVPPCGLNQTLWHITWNNRVEQCKVSSITQKADGSLKIRITPPSKAVFEITVDEVGKTVFLTKEEAEQKLKELK